MYICIQCLYVRHKSQNQLEEQIIYFLSQKYKIANEFHAIQQFIIIILSNFLENEHC